MNTFRFWIAFSVGVAAGATIALLCAPQSGDETRKQLKSKLDDAGDYIKDATGDLGDKATKAYQRSKDAVADYSGDLSDKASRAYKQGKDAVTEYTGNLAEKAQSAVRNVAH
jgi:gas vesicle protein